MKRQNKKWYDVVVSTVGEQKVFDNGKKDKSCWTVMAKVQGKGNAYRVADALQKVYKPDLYIIIVE